MKSMERVVFRGAGLNGSGFWAAVGNSLKEPSGFTPPSGASWPFVTLAVGDKTVKFDMPYIHKNASASSVKVTLGKTGYLYFRSANDTDDFGFATLKVDELLRNLDECGFELDESCRRNLLAAKISMFSTLILGVGALAAGTVLALLG